MVFKNSAGNTNSNVVHTLMLCFIQAGSVVAPRGNLGLTGLPAFQLNQHPFIYHTYRPVVWAWREKKKAKDGVAGKRRQ